MSERTDVTPYDAMRREIAAAETPGQATDIADKAEALRVLAQRSGDRNMELKYMELRVRAERQLGLMLLALKADGLLTDGRFLRGSPREPRAGRLDLTELGVDKKRSMQAQRAARVPEAEFDRRVAEWREAELQRPGRLLSSLRKAVARPAAPKATPALPEGRYRAILADPPWRFEAFSARGLDRGAENHYPTMTVDEIAALPVGLLRAPDCCLFLWIVGPLLPQALQVMDDWGFEFRSIAFAWTKQTKEGTPAMGLGYWTRQDTELCLLGTYGRPHPLARDVRQSILAPRREHSRKPDETYARIERLVEGPYVELFARHPKAGWDAWGNEAEGE